MFGTTVTLRTDQKYLSFHEMQSIFASMTVVEILQMLGESTTAIPLVFWRAEHMTHKRPFRDHERYLDPPLREVREEFGIEVVP